MARPDMREMQLTRARGAFDAALARGRLQEAADALLALPVDEREDDAASLAARLPAEHERLLRARENGPLFAWRACCEREPRLLPLNPSQLGRMRWCWLIAAIRTADWTRARTIFAEVEPALAGWSALSTLAALITHDGRLAASDVEALASETQRLGYDPPQKRTRYPCPARADELEAACMMCFALEPWQRFRIVVNDWLARAPRELTGEIARVAAALSRRELVLCAARDVDTALDVARWCALWSLQAERPPDLERVVALCVRVAARALAGTVTDRRVIEACTPIVAAALGYESLVEPVAQVALAAQFAGELVDAAVELLRPLVEHAASPHSILRVAAILAMQDENVDKAVAPPPWLLPAVERALQQPASLAAALGAPTANAAALYLFDTLPLALCVEACVRLFPVAEESARELLAMAAEDAAQRMRERPAAEFGLREVRAVLERFDPELSQRMSDPGLRRLLASPDGQALQHDLQKVGSFGLAGSVPEAWRAQLEQLAAPLMPYSVGLLDEALAFCRSEREERALVARFWSRRPRLTARFDALMAANRREYARALSVLARELLRGYQPEPEDAARALLSAEQVDAPRGIRKRIAEVLLSALADRAAVADARVAEARSAAQRLVKPRAARSSRKRLRAREPAKPKANGRSSKKAASKRQVELFCEGDNAP